MKALVFIIAIGIIVAAFDLGMIIAEQETISEVFQRICQKHSWFGYVIAIFFGILTVHLTSKP